MDNNIQGKRVVDPESNLGFFTYLLNFNAQLDQKERENGIQHKVEEKRFWVLVDARELTN